MEGEELYISNALQYVKGVTGISSHFRTVKHNKIGKKVSTKKERKKKRKYPY